MRRRPCRCKGSGRRPHTEPSRTPRQEAERHRQSVAPCLLSAVGTAESVHAARGAEALVVAHSVEALLCPVANNHARRQRRGKP
jgi:hypothetical protein